MLLDEISYLGYRTCDPADAVLTELERKALNSTVGYPYEVLLESDKPIVADLM